MYHNVGSRRRIKSQVILEVAAACNKNTCFTQKAFLFALILFSFAITASLLNSVTAQNLFVCAWRD